MLLAALMNMDRDELRQLAAAGGAAVRGHGARPARRRHLLPLPHAPAARPRRSRRADDGAGAAGRGRGSARTALEERLAREEFEAAPRRCCKELVEEEIRRRLVADRGVEAMARTLRKPLPEDVDFMHASREEMQRSSRRSAADAGAGGPARAAAPAAATAATLDFRQTVRHSLSYGGVPAEPKFKHPQPSKPEIMVVADISGSVASFARFTLQFVYAMAEPVLEGALVGVHRRHRRGHTLLRRVRRHHRGGAPRQHRGRRRLGRRPLRLRPRLRGVPRPAHPEITPKTRSSCSATRATTTTRRRHGCSRSSASRPAASTGSTPSRAATGTPATRSSRSTARTATASTSAATCASSQKFVEQVAEDG